MAKETMSICEQGAYQAPGGARVNIAEDLERAKRGTILYSAEQPPESSVEQAGSGMTIEVHNETTFAVLHRLSGNAGHLGCLNFASAKNPGGGFLGGSLAQEEALACASGLYPCLLKQPAYHERNRANRSALYLDLAIYSPGVPFFRNDDGALLESHLLASVITAPAPNAGAVAQNEPARSREVEPTMRKRVEMVLHIARKNQIDSLVLGAWGCGVFRNDPRMVASIFAEALAADGKFSGAFQRVVFAVFDRSAGQGTYSAFADKFQANK